MKLAEVVQFGSMLLILSREIFPSSQRSVDDLDGLDKVEHLVEVEVEAEGSALCGAEGGEGHAETVPGGGEW